MTPERSFTHLSLLLVEYCCWKSGEALKWEHEMEEDHTLKEVKPLLLRTWGVKGVKGELKLGLEDVKRTAQWHMTGCQ